MSGPACTFNIDPYVADSCPGDQICILDGGLGQPGRCEGAFGRLYTVNIGAAQVPERRADGECWDVGCGAPDLFVEVLLDGVPVVRTGVAADTFRVEDFGGRGSVVLTAQSRLDLVLYDEDLSVNDQIIGCRLDLLVGMRKRGEMGRSARKTPKLKSASQTPHGEAHAKPHA